METLIEKFSSSQLGPIFISWATNILLAIIILLIGLWFSGRVNKWIVNVSKKNTHLDDTLFRFFR